MKIISDIANLKLDIFKIRVLKIIIQNQCEKKFNNPKEDISEERKLGDVTTLANADIVSELQQRSSESDED